MIARTGFFSYVISPTYTTSFFSKPRLLNGSGVVGMDLPDGSAMDIKPPFPTNQSASLPKLTPSASSRFQPTNPSAATASSTGATTTPTTTKRRSLKRPAQSSSSVSSSNSNNNCAPPKSLQEPATVTTTSAQAVPPLPPQPSTTSSTLPDANVFLSINTVKQLGVSLCSFPPTLLMSPR